MIASERTGAVPPRLEGLRIVAVTSGWAMAEFCQCLIVVWRDQSTLETVELREKELTALAARFPGHCAAIEVIEATSPPPPAELRPITMRVYEQLAKELSCIALLLEGSSLKQTLNRAVITGMTFLVAQPLPTKAFKHMSDMSQWVKTSIGGDSPSFDSDMAAAIDHLRRRISAAQPTS